MTKFIGRGVRVIRSILLGATSAAGSGLSILNAGDASSPLVLPRASSSAPPLGAGILAAYARAPPPTVGPLPLPLEHLEAGGVGPRGAAGSASMGGRFLSASSYPANAPVEDRFDMRVSIRNNTNPSSHAQEPSSTGTQTTPSPSSSSSILTTGISTSSVVKDNIVLVAVFDGHGGWQAAEHARRTMLAKVAAELEAVPNEATLLNPTALGAILARTFVSVDTTFLDAIRPSFGLGFGSLAHVGACALAAIVTPQYIVVANAGDCRAVLGRVAMSVPTSGIANDDEYVDGHAVAAAALLDGRAGRIRTVPAGVTGIGGATFTILPEPAWRWRRLSTSDVGTTAGSIVGGDAGGGSSNKRGNKEDDSDTGLSTSSDSDSGTLPGAPPRERLIASPLYFAAIPMSLDHNAREPRERARLTKEHPDEADIVVCRKDSTTACYVKSRLQPTRALGDAYLKSADFNAPPNAGRLWGRHIHEPYTPPYISSCV